MPKDKEEKIKDKDKQVQDEEVVEFNEELATEVLDVEVPEADITAEQTEESPSEEAENVIEVEQDIQTDQTVTVQPIKFASFEDLGQTQGELNKNLDILLDIKLQLTVELGRAELPIKKVLELTRGSIIELEKVAGEPVELYANGKLIAHGEVVVIEDNFGLRITSITEPDERLKGI